MTSLEQQWMRDHKGRTKKKHDKKIYSNDYSRFNSIGADEGRTQAAPAPRGGVHPAMGGLPPDMQEALRKAQMAQESGNPALIERSMREFEQKDRKSVV